MSERVPLWFLVTREVRNGGDSLIIERHEAGKPIERTKVSGDVARQLLRILNSQFGSLARSGEPAA